LKIHLGIDSGMGRIGFNEDKDFIAANKFLKIMTIFVLKECLLILLLLIVAMKLTLNINVKNLTYEELAYSKAKVDSR
jgi:hypothetical protein